MPELQLGRKYECFQCGARFYDLGKPDPICPKCGANQRHATKSEADSERKSAARRRKDELLKAPDDEPEAIEGEAPVDFDDETPVVEGAEAAEVVEEELDDEA